MSAVEKMNAIGVNSERLWADLMEFASITDIARPYTRRSFGGLFVEGRSWLRRRFLDAGMSVREDAAPNLIARLEGTDPSLPVIAIGSHSDTVPSGGRFDGILGVLAGLEVVRALKEYGVRLRHSVEVIDFLAEEPSEYGLSCVGSRVMSGALDECQLVLEAPDGEQLADAMERIGGTPRAREGSLRNDIGAFLELHIEQGRVLEESGTQVGIVTGIVGIVRTEIIFEGEADHAGTTPMDLRRDALVAAAQTVLDVRKTAEDFAARYFFVATTGVIRCEPNASNVVPGRVRLIVEARSEHQSELSAFVDRLDDISMKAAMVNGVRRGGMKELSRSRPAPCNPALQHILRDAAADLGISSRALASGAGHDAAFIGRIAPMAMIFVPSKGGRSHCPDEWTSPEQCASGASVLLEALMRIDRNDMNHDDQGLTLGETAGETK